MTRFDGDAREVQRVIASIEWWDGRRAREVVANYDGTLRREIEIEENGRYVPRYRDINHDE